MRTNFIVLALLVMMGASSSVLSADDHESDCSHLSSSVLDELKDPSLLFASCPDCLVTGEPLNLTVQSSDVNGRTLLDLFEADSGIFDIRHDGITRVAFVNGIEGGFDLWIRRKVLGESVYCYLRTPWSRYVVTEKDQAVLLLSKQGKAIVYELR